MSLGPFKIIVSSPLASPLAAKANIADLAPVATAGTYDSLTGKPDLDFAPASVEDDVARSYDRQHDRPELQRAFSAQTTGVNRSPIGVGTLASNPALGTVLRLSGADASGGQQAIAPIFDQAVEAGRTYRVRAVIQRIADPVDPLGHAIELRLNSLGPDRAYISQTLLATIPNTVADGVQEVVATFSRGSGAASNARYALPFVRLYGDDHQTDIAVISVEDITDLSANNTELGDLDSRLDAEVAAREALDDRVDVVEAQLPTFATIAALDETNENLDQEIENREYLIGGITQGAIAPVTTGNLPLQIDQNGRSHMFLTADGVEVKQANPGSQRVPSKGGVIPIIINQTNAATIWVDENGKVNIAPMSSEPTAFVPVTNGITPNGMTVHGEASRAEYDGVPYDPGSVAQAIADPAGEVALGRTQAAIYDVDPGTLWPTRRVITYSQQGNIIPFDAASPGIIRAKGPDVDYPIGLVGWRAPMAATNFLDIIIQHGQSNGAGYDGDAAGTSPNPKFTLIAPLPGVALTFNGGPHPNQAGDSSGAAGTAINPSQYASLIDMVVGSREGSGIGAAETYAVAMDRGTTTLFINNAYSGTTFQNLVGTSGTDPQPWTDVIAMVNAAVTLANGMGKVARVRGFIWNQGEANDGDGVATYQGRLDVLRTKVDALQALTGRSERVPIILCQPASTVDLNTGNVLPAALAEANWAAIASNFAVAVPQYYTRTNDVATVHLLAQGHRHVDELSGHLIYEMNRNGGIKWPRVIAARRVGKKVTLTMSEPIAVDTKGVTDPGNYGITYRDSTSSRAVSGVAVDGETISFIVATPTGVGEVVSIACSGAKVYSAYSNRNGLGRDYGLRSCLRSMRKFWSHTTARPLWQWAAHQEFSVTVSS